MLDVFFLGNLYIKVSFWIHNKGRKSPPVWHHHIFHLNLRHVPSNTFGLKWFELLLPLSRTLSLFFLSCVCLQSNFRCYFALSTFSPGQKPNRSPVFCYTLKKKHSRTRIKWCDDKISRDTLYFCAWLCGRRKMTVVCVKPNLLSAFYQLGKSPGMGVGGVFGLEDRVVVNRTFSWQRHGSRTVSLALTLSLCKNNNKITYNGWYAPSQNWAEAMGRQLLWRWSLTFVAFIVNMQ